MHLELLARATPAVQFHVATVLPAFVLGTWLLLASRKGSPAHRAIGALYLLLMSLTALSTLFVHEIRPGGYSPIHLLIPLTLYGVIGGLRAIRRGDVRAHRRAMLGLYVGALLIAGVLTLLPGRLMYRVLFG